MITLTVRFPLGRYHATPWGAHVNEGQVDFPPAPWRILRALYAMWRERAPHLDETSVTSVLRALAEPPTYHVPPHRAGHTRHYMPDSTDRRGLAKPHVDKTLDAFVAVDPEAVLGVRWNVDLDHEQTKVLSALAEALPYLGRADSICEALVDPAWEPSPTHETWRPAAPGEPGRARLLCPAPGEPLDLDALVLRPVDLRVGRSLLFPPGTRQLDYSHGEAQEPTPARSSRTVGRSVTAVRFSLVGVVRPAVTDTLRVTEELHRKAAWCLDRERSQARGDSALLGCRADGEPMRDNHAHAHYLALPGTDGRGRIAELVVWAPGGLASDEVTALSRISRLHSPDPSSPVHAVDVRMSAVGGEEVLPPELVGPSRTWVSLTPWVPTGHPKRDRESFMAKRLDHDLHAARTRAGEPLPGCADQPVVDPPMRAELFQRRREKERRAHAFTPPAAWLKLSFDEPVRGPVAIGRHSHYGLGLFTRSTEG